MSMIPTYGSTSKKSSYKHVKEGVYPARLVRFIGLGIQEQPDYQGQAKKPAFKVATQWELYDSLTGQPLFAVDADGTTTDKPSCIFQDFFLFPGAERGKVFDMCKAFDSSIEKTPKKLEWFFSRLGSAAQLQVTQYKKRTEEGEPQQYGNGIASLSAVIPMMLNALPQPKTALVGFDPYEDTEENKVAFAMMFPFQREILKDAKDAKHMPLCGTTPIKLEEVTAKEQQAPEVANPPPASADFFKDDPCPFF